MTTTSTQTLTCPECCAESACTCSTCFANSCWALDLPRIGVVGDIYEIEQPMRLKCASGCKWISYPCYAGGVDIEEGLGSTYLSNYSATLKVFSGKLQLTFGRYVFGTPGECIYRYRSTDDWDGDCSAAITLPFYSNPSWPAAIAAYMPSDITLNPWNCDYTPCCYQSCLCSGTGGKTLDNGVGNTWSLANDFAGSGGCVSYANLYSYYITIGSTSLAIQAVVYPCNNAMVYPHISRILVLYTMPGDGFSKYYIPDPASSSGFPENPTTCPTDWIAISNTNALTNNGYTTFQPYWPNTLTLT